MTDITPLSNQQIALSRINSVRNQAAGVSSSEAGGRSADSVELSDTAHFLAKLKDLPDVREDLVARVKAEIEDETYLTDDKIDGAVEGLLEDLG